MTLKRPLCLLCMIFALTVFIYNRFVFHPQDIREYEEGRQITIAGEVYRKEYRDNNLVISLKNIKESDSDNKISDSGVICYIKTGQSVEEPKLGSVLKVEGKVSYFKEKSNPGSFDIRKYYQVLGISYKLYNTTILYQSSRYSIYHESLYRLRCRFERIFDASMTSKDSSIMKAMILGDKSELDSDSKQLFQQSGIAHILAISGLHITFLGSCLCGFLKKLRIPNRICTILSVGVMIAYGDMAGMSSSAYRAVFMFAMKSFAGLLRRTYDMLTALALAAVLILAEQPMYIENTGFLLSFGAILGIGCLSEVVMPVKSNSKLISSLCGSLSIFLVHFPIMLSTYYEFPIYSFILNLIIIPAMTIVMIEGIMCLGFGSIPLISCLGMAKIAGALCHLFIALFENLCKLSLKLPFSSWITGKPENWKICIFIIIVIYLYLIHNHGKYISKESKCEERGIKVRLPVCIRFVTIIVAVYFISSRTVFGATMTFLDVGQGDCIYVESDRGEHFLIDAGSTSESMVGKYTLVPYLKYMGVSKLDAVFITHLDSDHISAIMELLDDGSDINSCIDIGRICISDAVIEDEAYQKLVNICNLSKIPLYRLKTGDMIEAGDICFEILHPSEQYQASSRNAYSLVMRLRIKDNFTALLTGDAEADAELTVSEYLAEDKEQKSIDVYKAAHHGSKYSNTRELISTVTPKLVIISCGRDNRYGHPHKEAVKNFEDAGSHILTTKDTGAVTIKIYDDRYMVDTYK